VSSGLVNRPVVVLVSFAFKPAILSRIRSAVKIMKNHDIFVAAIDFGGTVRDRR
jgi:hypothetical protein